MGSNSSAVIGAIDQYYNTEDRDVPALAGFCDKHFYDGDTLMATLMEVDASAADITRMETPWNSFISTQPAAIIFRNSSRLLLTMPWSNVKPPNDRSDTEKLD